MPIHLLGKELASRLSGGDHRQPIFVYDYNGTSNSIGLLGPEPAFWLYLICVSVYC